MYDREAVVEAKCIEKVIEVLSFQNRNDTHIGWSRALRVLITSEGIFSVCMVRLIWISFLLTSENIPDEHF